MNMAGIKYDPGTSSERAYSSTSALLSKWWTVLILPFVAAILLG